MLPSSRIETTEHRLAQKGVKSDKREAAVLNKRLANYIQQRFRRRMYHLSRKGLFQKCKDAAALETLTNKTIQKQI